MVGFSLSSCRKKNVSEIRNLEIFRTINFDQTIRIHDNNLDCKDWNTFYKLSQLQSHILYNYSNLIVKPCHSGSNILLAAPKCSQFIPS
jgi:hypothetical protein